MCVLIVEDNARDMQFAKDVTRDAGFKAINAETSLQGAEKYLQGALEGVHRMPDAIVLDLVLGLDSGFDLLRLRYTTPLLANVPVIVWTEHDEHNDTVCKLFKVDAFVGKWTGAAGLRQAIRDLGLPLKPGPPAPSDPKQMPA
jgi:DNA-binding response OmpR family regulator